jgi:hypothetical protein
MARGDGFFKSEEGVGTKCPRSLLCRHPLFSCYYFIFSFCKSRSVIANSSIIGALGPWSPWLSFYCQFTIIFVFLFFIVPFGCHTAMFELRIFTLCKKKRMESSAVFFSCSLEMVKKTSVG